MRRMFLRGRTWAAIAGLAVMLALVIVASVGAADPQPGGIGNVSTAGAATSPPEVVSTVGASATTINSIGTTTTGVTNARTNASLPAVVGQSVTFTATGFNANEAISMWTTSPDRQVIALSGQQADNVGTLSVSVTFPSSGFWQVTAHGIDSTHEVIGGFTVTDTTSAAGTPVAGATTTPTAGNAIAAAPNQAVTFSGSGFDANERLALWTTAPDGSVAALDGINATNKGAFSINVSFPSTGTWHVTAHGVGSAREVIGTFSIQTGATPTATPSTTGTSIPGQLTTANYGPTTVISIPTVNSSLVTPSAAQLTPPASTASTVSTVTQPTAASDGGLYPTVAP